MTTQLMLPGQAAAPPGPCDLTAMYLIHHAFRRDLRRFALTADRTPAAATSTWTAVLDRWDRFALLLHDHHTKEDEVLWPRLTERAGAAGDLAGLRVLADMAEEHAAIDPLLAEARTRLTAYAEGRGSEADRTALHEVLLRTGAVLGDHLGHEERAAVALMQRYLDGAEWTRLENTELRSRLSPAMLVFFLSWAAEGLAPEVLGPVRAKAGLPFRVLLRLGRRRFARLERAAFGDLAGTLTDQGDV